MRRHILLPLFAVLLTAGLSTEAQAQDLDEATGRKILYKTKTEIDFEGIEVAGELVKPQGALLLDRKRGSFNPLIKLRANFNEQMEHSVDMIK